MKTIQTKSGKVLLIKIPENATDFKISNTNYLCFLIENNWEASPPRLQDDSKILGKFLELKDKDFEKFIEFKLKTIYPEKFKPFTIGGYRNYEVYGNPYYNIKSAKKSFQTLCKSQGMEDDLNNYLVIEKL